MLYWLKLMETQVETVTYVGYKSNVEKRIAPYFRRLGITLVDLRPIDIQEFYTYCLSTLKVSGNTVLHYHANISKALKYAVRKDLILSKPNGEGRPAKSVEAHRPLLFLGGNRELD